MAQAGNDRSILIACRDVQKTFYLGERAVPAIKRVSLEIRAGEFVGIMGPSGSGKSTLLYLLGGLDRATGGTIRVAGQRLEDLNSDELARFRRRTIGFVFQAFHLIPSMTALDNVALPGVFAALPRRTREERAWRLLRAMGLTHRADHRPGQLSSGQQQRVAIARALFNDPPVVLADEPTGALDSRTGQRVMRLLRYLCDRWGKTIIVVTHDPVVASHADRILNLQDGYLIGERVPQAADKPDA